MFTKHRTLFSAIFLITMLNYVPAEAQLSGWLKKQKDKILNKIDSLTSKKVDKLLNGKESNSPSQQGTDINNNDNATQGRPKGSAIKDADFVQNVTNPPLDSNNTRVMIAKNLFVDIKGRYPQGYGPKWRFIGTSSNLDFDVDDYVFPTTYQKHETKTIGIGDYEGKAVLSYNAFSTCDCYAEIEIDSFAVLTAKPQTFRIIDFQKVLNSKTTGEKCRSDWNTETYANGGFEGEITLSANENGDIKMSLMIENYSQETTSNNYDPVTRSYPVKINPPAVSFRYTANNISLNNDMSAQKANEIIAEENAAKQRQVDFVNRSKKQVDSLMKVIVKKYPGTECSSCFYRSRGVSIDPTTTNYYYVDGGGYAGSSTDYNLNTSLVIKNKCDYKIMFIGIEQLYDDNKGYYYKDVTQTMDAGYEYTTNQGMFSYAFTSLLGLNSDLILQKEYCINCATVNSIQWLRVIKSTK
ncbi:MAG TPA: hypothetical protein VG738_19290 [Chitinophagaceae bacterium]|nr:hypothetical protein [Chitinophagaceae bacterium]